MDDPFVMGGADRGQYRQRDVDDLIHGERAAAPEMPGQVLALEVLHHQKRLPAFHADVGDVDRVRVADARRQLRLEHEPGPRLRDRGERRADRLDRDALAHLHVEALVHRAHPPAPRKRTIWYFPRVVPGASGHPGVPVSPPPYPHCMVNVRSDAEAPRPAEVGGGDQISGSD